MGKSFLMHSFKGGSGRTVTTANVAAILAKDYGKKVIIIDMDLESAGTSVLFDIAECTDNKNFNTVQSILSQIESIADMSEERFLEFWNNSHRDIKLADGKKSGGWLKVMPSSQSIDGHDNKTVFSKEEASSFRSIIRNLSSDVGFDILFVDSPSGLQGAALFGLHFCDHMCEFVRWSRQFTLGAQSFIKKFSEAESYIVQSALIIPVAVPDEKPENNEIVKNLVSRAEAFVSAVKRSDSFLINRCGGGKDRIRIFSKTISEERKEPPSLIDGWSDVQEYLSGISENPILKWDDVVFGMEKYSHLAPASEKAIKQYEMLAEEILKNSQL